MILTEQVLVKHLIKRSWAFPRSSPAFFLPHKTLFIALLLGSGRTDLTALAGFRETLLPIINQINRSNYDEPKLPSSRTPPSPQRKNELKTGWPKHTADLRIRSPTALKPRLPALDGVSRRFFAPEYLRVNNNYTKNSI